MASCDTVSNPIANNNPRMHYISTGKTRSALYKILPNAKADGGGVEHQKAEETKQITLAWIQDFIAQNPDGIIDNRCVFAQPSFEHMNIKSDQEFPALPPFKPATAVLQGTSKKPTKKTTDISNSPNKKNPTAIQKRPDMAQKVSTQAGNAIKLGSVDLNWSISTSSSSKNENKNPTTRSQQHTQTSACNNNPWSRPLKPWAASLKGRVLLASPPDSTSSSAVSTASFADQQHLLSRKILDTSHGPGKNVSADSAIMTTRRNMTNT
ncbi:hypothetical protein N431DRAFT_525942 [Stipitochalara longipes BDJ]|nr:hypothetical protein N431DRAFT_525942 [Stipitochalara longipes BDJ]